jgi:glycoside/pentoside/hexuronide:cation symporter, GPH family
MTYQGRDRSTLPLADKLLYATACIGNNAMFFAQVTLVIVFYTGSANAPQRLAPTVMALALGVGKFIELFDDPLIGWWSDATKSRWGRRIPFILLGTPVIGISFWLLWSPPPPEAGWLNLVWFFVAIEIFFLARTIVEAPYEALQAEITTSPAERVSLGAYKVAFSFAGAAAGMVAAPLLVELLGYSGMGAVIAVASVATIYLMLFGLWRRGTLDTGAGPVEKPPLLGSLLGTLRNGNFRALALSFLFFSLGFQLLTVMLGLFVTRVLGLSDGAIAAFTGGVIVFAVIALPALNRLARLFTKRVLYGGAMALLSIYLLVASIGLFVQLLPGVMFFTQTLILISLAGLGFGAMWLYPGAMVADIIDEDRRQHGEGRAAVFYGMYKTLEKFAQAGALILSGIVFWLFGDTAARSLGIQLLMPLAAAVIFLGFVAVWMGYRIREAPGSGPALAEVTVAAS